MLPRECRDIPNMSIPIKHIILDLDETLWHAEPAENCPCGETVETPTCGILTFTCLTLDFEEKTYTCHLHVRPGARELLAECRRRNIGISVYTAASHEFAEEGLLFLKGHYASITPDASLHELFELHALWGRKYLDQYGKKSVKLIKDNLPAYLAEDLSDLLIVDDCDHHFADAPENVFLKATAFLNQTNTTAVQRDLHHVLDLIRQRNDTMNANNT